MFFIRVFTVYQRISLGDSSVQRIEVSGAVKSFMFLKRNLPVVYLDLSTLVTSVDEPLVTSVDKPRSSTLVTSVEKFRSPTLETSMEKSRYSILVTSVES